MARQKGTLNPDLTDNLALMAELLVGFMHCGCELSIPAAAGLVEQMRAAGIDIKSAVIATKDGIRWELLEALTRGKLALSPEQNLRIERARERAAERTPARFAGTKSRRQRAACYRAGKSAITEAVGETSKRLAPKIATLARAYCARGQALEDRWFEAYESVECAELRGVWVLG